MSEVPVNKTCKQIAYLRIYKPAPLRKTILIGLCVVLYAIVLPPVWNTMGDPRRRASLELEELKSKKISKEDQLLKETDGEVVLSWDDDDEDEDEDVVLEEVVLKDIVLEDTSIEKNSTDDEEEDERPLPNWFIPDAFPAAALFCLLTGTVLFQLLCRWFVWFYAWMYFEPATAVDAGCSALVTPYAHHGKPEMVLIVFDPREKQLVFEFQKLRFKLDKQVQALSEVKLLGLSNEKNEKVDVEEEELVIAKLSESERIACEKYTRERMEQAGVASPIVCRVDLPMKQYVVSRGLASSKEIEKLANRFGLNSLAVEMKTMPDLVIEGMLSPLAIFQFFSAGLWLMDEYWQYTIFNLFTIVMMEAMTAFQRFRTLKTLKGLAPKPYELPVYRESKWVKLKTTELLPGDLISLASLSHQAGEQQSRGTDAIPCDCLILDGNAVVNEATLTGESVPQMKDSLKMTSHANMNSPLDINGRDRVNVMFSGTTLITASPGEGDFPVSPDGGCLCLVLRTGFGSSQGELMQMIEFSTESVSADSKETGVALLVLFCFALCSAGYVFKRGMEKGDRTTHELLLKCVMILTSVVPRQLPVQMALAVNHALMTLMKEGIFCTEPYRVPYSGKITHCLFDKTGTLTTDELVPVGVVCASSKDESVLTPVKDADTNTAMVLAGCHSLVSVSMPLTSATGKPADLLGDPIEVAALKGVQWGYDPKTQIAVPGDATLLNFAASKLEADMKLEGANIKVIESQLAKVRQGMEECHAIADKSTIQAVRILERFHFASKLQRMSVVCKYQHKGKNEFAPEMLCLVKGSPEAVLSLVTTAPSWYNDVYRRLAEDGMRVLALAFKHCKPGADLKKLSREQVESDLTFAGFIAFECKTRSDSAIVIRSLIEADHKVGMLTGDAPLTALHVARKTHICSKPLVPLLLTTMSQGGVEWVAAVGSQDVKKPFVVEEIVELHKNHDLLTTEDALLSAVNMSQGKLWKYVDEIDVFARMSPQGKAKVIRMIQQYQEEESGEISSFVASKQVNFVLMCGDGGNDVGALKQADVGLALLGGYGNANAEGIDVEGVDAEEALNKEAKILKIKSAEAAKKHKVEFDKKKKEIMAKQQEMVQAYVSAAAARGEEGFMVQVNAVKAVTMQLRQELMKANELLSRKYNVVLKKDSDNPTQMALDALDDPNALPIVRPGDASIAAPFTSRTPSVKSVVQLIRQGRCTLLSALQQQQIMMLECTISAYCLAALSLEGARSSERQMMASSWLIMSASLAFSYSTPIEKMHHVRPIRSLFNPAIFISILGQAAIHLFCMVTAVSLAKAAMGEDKLKEVIAFNRRVARGLAKEYEKQEEEGSALDSMAEVMMMWQAPFMPNLMNTVIFLVETSQIMAVLFVNYKGRPWMLGIVENHALFLSLFMCIGALVFCTWEVSPELNRLIHLESFPNDEFRWNIIGLVTMTLFGTFIWDRLVTALFAKKIFKAMTEQAFQTSFSDLLPVFGTLAKAVGFFGVMATGNPLVWFGAWWGYRKYQSSVQEQEAQALLQ